MIFWKYLWFGVGVAAFVYILNSLIARRLMRPKLKPALLYFTTVGAIGLFGEIFLDTSYNFFVGHPLWYYNLLPIQGGYTSAFAIVTWGLYGIHLYLLHDTLATKWSITRTRHLAIIFSLEALVFEALLTLSAKAVFGKYLYYYLPADLWHVSSFQNMPFYFICGAVVLKTLKRFRQKPLFFTGMNTFLLVVLLMVT
ncbi:MAG TPA: hypothetical protein VLE99_05665 [Candidatus Saccharimonadales bacterium]|nr:hypothetical protein [Candidatus Saccharimonadales bacterium]